MHELIHTKLAPAVCAREPRGEAEVAVAKRRKRFGCAAFASHWCFWEEGGDDNFGLSIPFVQESAAVYTSKPEYLNCSADVVGGLIETVSVALMDNFPKSTVDCDDVGLVLDALHVLRPDAPELDALDGILYIVKGRFDDAIRVLRQVIARAPAFAYARALLAFSLAAKGDPDWRQCASEVIEGGQSGDAEKLVRVLIARHDLMDARRARRLGGDFVMPESVMTLMESSQAATSSSSAIPPARDEARAPAEQLSGAVHYQGFLRA